MGYGNYSHEAHTAIARGRAALSKEQVFQQTKCHPLMDPKGVTFRESRDTADHPQSLAIAFALDVTGSMGGIPADLAKKELPEFMRILGECKVPDPQLLFLAVGDATSDRAPLQVGQFESTAELMDQWLTWTYLEGNGGGQNTESYELALYFLAAHTSIDCFEKRKKRGYIFMTGDELPYPAVSKKQVDGICGNAPEDDIPTENVIATVAKTYHPFFLIPDPERRARCERRWRDLLGDYVIVLDSPRDTCYVSAALVALTEKLVPDVDALARILRDGGCDRARVGGIVRAIEPYLAARSASTGSVILPKSSVKSAMHRISRA